MKKIFLLFFFLTFFLGTSKEITFKEDPNVLIEEMSQEIILIQTKYWENKTKLSNKITTINQQLRVEKNSEVKLNLLIEKDLIKTEIENLTKDSSSDISKVRYIKGLQIIKILYEKVLGLDHHFASVRTFSEISKIANPNQYPEFEKVNELIKNKKDKKSGFDLTAILGSNSVVSVINTFSNMLISNLSKEEKDTELAKIECILDFTLRMQNDLNTVYYETAFLQSSNETIKTDLENLFRDYTKPIGYTTTIQECRNQDDWDIISVKLDTYLFEITKTAEVKREKMQINVEFPVDRLIQFIGQYNAFINQGEQFYQKFNIILNSYENQKQCESKLPIEFGKMKTDIGIAIDKFNIAYKPVEINGSKMKEILYGINEFQ